jgi:hypothetical protein
MTLVNKIIEMQITDVDYSLDEILPEIYEEYGKNILTELVIESLKNSLSLVHMKIMLIL